VSVVSGHRSADDFLVAAHQDAGVSIRYKLTMRPWRLLPIVLAGALLAGCGSTAQLTAGSRGGDDGLSIGSAPGSDNASSGPGAAPAGASTAAAGPTGGTQLNSSDGSTGATSGGSGGPVGGVRRAAPGVTSTTIRIGLAVAGSSTSTGSQVAQNYGIGGFSAPPDHSVQDALVRYVNAHGGVNGRKLVPVYETYDPNDTSPYEQQSQRACTFFTQDNHVFAHIDVVSDATFFTCMEQAGTVGVERYDISPQRTVTPYRGIFFPGDLDPVGVASMLGSGLAAGGFLTRSSRIGVVQEDNPVYDQARSAGLEPALRAAGVAGISDLYRIPAMTQSADAASAVSAVNSAVLRFHTDGIDRILFLSQYGALVDAIFMKDASQQHYYPKYGLSTEDGPVALTGGNAPADQLSGSVGVGWQPLLDVNQPASGDLAPSIPTCMRALHDGGVPAPADNGQYFGELGYCETIFLFVAIASRAGADLDRNTYIAAGESLGRDFVDQLTIRGTSDFHGASVHDGVAAWHTFAYVDSCDCYRTRGQVQPWPHR
jgi:hypothetical protein